MTDSTVCRWCGVERDKHTPGQLGAAAMFLRVLGTAHAYDAEPVPSPSVKLSKSNERAEGRKP